MKKDIKQTAVKYMGGSCMLCGYSRCLRALHFHHLNPNEKDFNISKASFWEDAKEELDKCILVCANCHAEIHSGLVDHEYLADLKEGL